MLRHRKIINKIGAILAQQPQKHKPEPALMASGAHTLNHKGAPIQPDADYPDSLVVRLTKLNVQVLGTTLFVTFLLVAASLWFGLRSHQIQNTEASAAVLANSLAPTLLFHDKKSAMAELNAYAKRNVLLSVQLFDLQGQIFVGWQRIQGASAEVEPNLLLPLRKPQLEMSWQSFSLTVPVHFQNEPLGFLRISESLNSLQQAMAWLLGFIALITLLTLFLAAKGLRLMQQRVLQPIVELAELADYAARHHDYSQRGKIRRKDEVGRLTERLNELFKRTEIWQGELKQQLKSQQQAGEAFKQLAHHDSLTALPNRLYFQNELQKRTEQSLKSGQRLALMFIDLDNFKTVNDSFGHDYGDEVLKIVASRMQQTLRNDDVLCRLGGDEFAVLLRGFSDEQDIEALATRLIQAICLPMFVQQHLMPVGATVGLAFFPQDANDAALLLQKADEAMYQAKKAGKNTYRRVTHD